MLIPVLAALLALLIVPGADALNLQQPFTETISPDASALAPQQRPYTGTFGSAAQPVTVWGTSITVERDTGDVLVLDFLENTLTRFHADGTPAPFAALGTNVIDGKEANGKPCSEEPASCDKTPENEINGNRQQIAVDESDGPTKGDIYLDQDALIDIFAPDGHYLGQLTQTGPRDFPGGGVSGVAVDTNGTVYVANGNDISKFVPSANPVVNDDFTTNLVLTGQNGLQGLAMGSGPTAGSIFTTTSEVSLERPIAQINKETGQLEFEFGKGEEPKGLIAIDPHTHNVVTGSGAEYEAPGGSQPVKVGRFIPHKAAEHIAIQGLAINGSSELLVTEGVEPGTISVYGAPAPVPAVTAEPASEVTGTRATLTGTVNPGGLPVTKCIFEYFEEGVGITSEAACEGSIPTDSSSHPVHVTITGLEPNGHTYDFRLVAFSANGQEETTYQSLTTATTVVTEPATALGLTTATLTGTLRPEGEAYSECFFEYGLSTSVGFEKKVPCNPGAPAIPLDFVPHEVKAAITGLQSGSTYRYRLVATNSLGTLQGEEVYFGTFGPPVIEEVHASGADQSSVTLEAKVNPSGFGTSYRFEWGPSAAYGKVAPVEFEPFLGSGVEPIFVKTKLTGLSAASTYHYRVVATSSRGATQSPDHTAETLDSCGLPDGRCFEEVSRHEAGPVAIPGEANAFIEMHYQAATGGEGGLAYPIEFGYPEASKGADVLYRALRAPGGWESTQLSPPISALNERKDVNSVSSKIQFLSNNLGCGVAESTQPLTADPSMRLVRELGASNLYRINPDGTYTGVTNLPPENVNPEAEETGISNYKVAGVSQDCGVVLFGTKFAYPGVVTKGRPDDGERLYEWNEGTLRNAGLVPGPSDPVVVVAIAGGEVGQNALDTQNAVSESGSRVFFTAERQTSPDPAEIGAKAIFVREDGGVGRDISLSQTATPDTGALYQWATADGSRVFFTANAGLTAESNSEGTDLYEYNLETNKLTDRSPTTAAGGAEVSGFLGASADGSQVYFASPNQLIPGSGNTRAQNVSAHSYSIYGEKGSEISFVGTFSEQYASLVLMQNQEKWTSQVSPNGRYLLFQSTERVTRYNSNGQLEAYLYDADGGSHGTICVSCRQDGLPSLEEEGDRHDRGAYTPLSRNGLVDELHQPQFLTMHDGEPQVFFNSPDLLAPGAVAGQNNVYEWSHDQVYRLVSANEGTQVTSFTGFYAVFGGASEDGSDVYLVTPETLTWEDGDQRLSVYDARIDGGFPEPAAPPAPCNATTEGSCQGAGQAGTAVPGAGTETYSGPGSPEQKQQPPAKQQQAPVKKKAKKKPKKKPKKNGKKKTGKQKSSKAKKQSTRQANGNRRAGK